MPGLGRVVTTAAHAAPGDNPDAETVQAVLERVDGKWMAVVCYACAAPARPEDGTAAGVDMNAGQVAVSAAASGSGGWLSGAAAADRWSGARWWSRNCGRLR